MSYVFKNLKELADLFSERAERCMKAMTKAHDRTAAASWEGEALGWRNAADIVRRTTITEDVSCREI